MVDLLYSLSIRSRLLLLIPAVGSLEGELTIAQCCGVEDPDIEEGLLPPRPETPSTDVYPGFVGGVRRPVPQVFPFQWEKRWLGGNIMTHLLKACWQSDPSLRRA